MEAAMRPIGVSDEQVRHWDRMERQRHFVVRAAETASSSEDTRQRRDQQLATHDAQHPGWTKRTYTKLLWSWGIFVSLVAALFVVEPVLTAPVSESLLHSYAGISSGAAAIFKWVGTAMVGLIEFGMATAREKARDDERFRVARVLATVAVLLALTMAALVGYTQAAFDHSGMTAKAVEAGVDPSPSMSWSPLVFLVAGLTLLVHLWVSFGPHTEALAFVTWSMRRGWLRSRLRKAAESVVTQTRLARNQFAALIATRDQYAASYPDSVLPDLRWTNETIRVLREPTLDDASGAPRVLEPTTIGVQGPTAGQAPPVQPPPAQPTAQPRAQTGHDESDLLREILARRVRETDGAVS